MLRFLGGADPRTRFNLATNTRPGRTRSLDGFSIVLGTHGGYTGDYVRFIGTSSNGYAAVRYRVPGVYGRAGARLRFGATVRCGAVADLYLYPETYYRGQLTSLPAATATGVAGGSARALTAHRAATADFDEIGVAVQALPTTATPDASMDVAYPLLEPTTATSSASFFDGASSVADHTTAWLGEPYRSASRAAPNYGGVSSLLLLSWDEDTPSRVVELEPPGAPGPILLEPLGGRMRTRGGTLTALMTPAQLAGLRDLARRGSVGIEDTDDPTRGVLVDVRGIADRHVPGTRVALREVTVTWREAAA